MESGNDGFNAANGSFGISWNTDEEDGRIRRVLCCECGERLIWVGVREGEGNADGWSMTCGPGKRPAVNHRADLQSPTGCLLAPQGLWI